VKAAARFAFGLLALPVLFAYSRLTRREWRITRLAHWALGWHKGMLHAPSSQYLGKCWCTRNDPPLWPMDLSPRLGDERVAEALAAMRESSAGRQLLDSFPTDHDLNRKHPE
jgi:hypothetical protein